MGLKKGLVPIALLAVVVVGIAVISSVKLFAEKTADERQVVTFFDRICKINPNLPQCQKLKPTPTPVPKPSKISWNTPYASLEADTMEIIVGDKRFSGHGKLTDLHSDPGSSTYQTLEIIWTENDIPMRLFIYFSADGKSWKVTELRTYNGQNPGAWIIYPGFGGNLLGQSLKKEDFELKGVSDPGGPAPGVKGVIRFKNMALQAFNKPTGCYQNPTLTFDQDVVTPGQQVTAKVTRPENCTGKNLVSVENHNYFGPDNPEGPVGQCSFEAFDGGRVCYVIFSAPDIPNSYYFQAGMDIDDNGTFDTWSSGSYLTVTSGPSPSQSPPSTPSASPKK